MLTEIDTQALAERVEAGDVQLVEVLPAAEFEEEHLPGAISLPLPDLRPGTTGELDPDRPVVPYCFDYQCDLSARAAHRLESLGFEVLHYVAGKAAWLAMGLPAEGWARDSERAGTIAMPLATVPLKATISDLDGNRPDNERTVVVDADGVVLGALDAAARRLPADTPVEQAMQPGPPTVRPSIRAPELAESMDKDQQARILVTTLDGRLVGQITRDQLHGQP